MISERYDPKTLEGKWQRIWEQKKVFEAPNPTEDLRHRPKFYSLSMFPYPSGEIHMGHLRNYSIGDVISRYKRMRGYNVLQPIGWDAFGLPAENAAIEQGVHPREWTLNNIVQMQSDLRSMGLAYDWSREVTTCLPEYYRWEQLMFRKFFEQGLVYRNKGLLNWCPRCETVLANEQVHEGRCWRCDTEIAVKELSQWYFRITLYAEDLLKGHSELIGKWPDRVIEMQRHWIGESQGYRIFFNIEGHADRLEVFTTRPDTLFGVTFVTVAPTHPLISKLVKSSTIRAEVDRLAAFSRNVERAPVEKKEGVFTGSYCVHPMTGERLPIWVGNFIVMEYGTGAVMAVPAHDERDHDFAMRYQLPIRHVVVPKDSRTISGAYTEPGILVGSGEFTGMDSKQAKTNIAEELAKRGAGLSTIQYRLRDWGISRQRYWGTPIPVIHCNECGIKLVPESELPVVLPTQVSFTGKGGNPLEKVESFWSVPCPQCGKRGRRETDTMDTFVESSWYYARYTSPHYREGPFDPQVANQWLPVDYYIGGIEHACMHLLYARFFHKVMRDWGWLSSDEPFNRLLTQGMVIKDGHKMSKSKGNVVSPRAIIEKYGADTGRLFSLFAAPPEKDLEWNEKGMEGCYRFLCRVWRLFFQFQETLSQPRAAGVASYHPDLVAIRRKTHGTIHKMTGDLEATKFNTAIASLMELVNEIYLLLSKDGSSFESPGGRVVLGEALETLVVMLAPFAPHLSEELWSLMGRSELVAEAKWPTADPSLLSEETFVLVVQVNGKMRDKLTMMKGTSQETVKSIVLQLPRLKAHLEGKIVKQVVYVPERLVNVVVD